MTVVVIGVEPALFCLYDLHERSRLVRNAFAIGSRRDRADLHDAAVPSSDGEKDVEAYRALDRYICSDMCQLRCHL